MDGSSLLGIIMIIGPFAMAAAIIYAMALNKQSKAEKRFSADAVREQKHQRAAEELERR